MGPLLGIAVAVIVALVLAYVASRYKVANANEALIIAGRRGAKVKDEKGNLIVSPEGDKGVKVVVGGGTIVWPLVNRVGKLKLTARQISVQLQDAVTSQGIKVQVQGVATFKIGRDVESLRNAAERFLDAKDDQVDSIVKNVLEGSLRAIVGTLTVEELIRDRQKLLQQVQDAAKGDLATSGLQIDAFTIQSFQDDSNYITLLGQQNLSVVERDARMAKASMDQDAAVREAQAQQVKIDAQRDVSLRQAETQTQVLAANARAEQAGPLAQAEAQQEVVRKQTELAVLEAQRTEQELLSSTVKPAAAAAAAAVQTAEGQKRVTIAAAEAQAEQVRLQGGAEAAIVLTKGEAEAKALAMRADAYKQFNEAAIIQTILAALPEIVRAAAEPMGNIETLTVLSSEGASDMVKNTTRTVAEATAMIKGLTGVDVASLVGSAMGGTAASPGRRREAMESIKQGEDSISKIAHSESLEIQKDKEVIEHKVDEIQNEVKADVSQVEKTVEKAKEIPYDLKTAANEVKEKAIPAHLSHLTEVEGVTPHMDELARLMVRELKKSDHFTRDLHFLTKYMQLPLNDLVKEGPADFAPLWGVVGADFLKLYGGWTLQDIFEKFKV